MSAEPVQIFIKFMDQIWRGKNQPPPFERLFKATEKRLTGLVDMAGNKDWMIRGKKLRHRLALCLASQNLERLMEVRLKVR